MPTFLLGASAFLVVIELWSPGSPDARDVYGFAAIFAGMGFGLLALDHLVGRFFRPPHDTDRDATAPAPSSLHVEISGATESVSNSVILQVPPGSSADS